MRISSFAKTEVEMHSLYIVASLALLAFSSASPIQKDADEDADLTVPELITKYGYPAEEHHVTTEDGYILTLHRIPHGKNSATVSTKVAFLMHGILSSSADWVITGPDHALAYILADEGYDIWMGNARGNALSRNHTTLNPDTDADAFWNFSWHEIGTTDVPAMIDYVLANTGQSQLYHIGHSQGTTSYYVMATRRPEYNLKIKAHFSLAPIAFMNHMTSPLMHIMAFWTGPIDLLLAMIGVHEFLPNNDFMELIGNVLCADGDITQALCSNALFVICGFSPAEMNATIFPAMMGHTPAGASVRQMLHYAQEINSGAFRQYDWGLENLVYYGQLTPPSYDLSLVTAPAYLLYSHNDWLSAEEDVVRLCEGIGNACAGRFLVADDSFNHLDYMYGINAPKYVYNRLISLMARNN